MSGKDEFAKKIKTRYEILATMREAAIAEEYSIEIGIKVKRRFMFTMVEKSTLELRGKIEVQISKEESQLEQQKQVVKIIEELLGEIERANKTRDSKSAV